jgi:hypothetical protein
MTGSLHYVLSNSDADRQAALQEAEEYGRKEGGGAAARAGFYYDLVEKAKDKRFDVADAPSAWDRYDKGAAVGASMIGGIKAATDDTKSADVRKVRVSECRQFLKMGGIVYIDPVEVMGRACAIIKRQRLDGTLRCKPTDAMIAVARAQCNDEQNPLEDETIEAVIQPKVANEKQEEDRLDKIRIELEAVVKKFGESDELNNAIAYVQKRIDDLGGTTRAKKAAAAMHKKKGK